jgi:hypothetical protein
MTSEVSNPNIFEDGTVFSENGRDIFVMNIPINYVKD